MLPGFLYVKYRNDCHGRAGRTCQTVADAGIWKEYRGEGEAMPEIWKLPEMER